jgi:hypothetical protein
MRIYDHSTPFLVLQRAVTATHYQNVAFSTAPRVLNRKDVSEAGPASFRKSNIIQPISDLSCDKKKGRFRNAV